jgi:hypothetical protein
MPALHKSFKVKDLPLLHFHQLSLRTCLCSTYVRESVFATFLSFKLKDLLLQQLSVKHKNLLLQHFCQLTLYMIQLDLIQLLRQQPKTKFRT